jgi:hypothetical protein
MVRYGACRAVAGSSSRVAECSRATDMVAVEDSDIMD